MNWHSHMCKVKHEVGNVQQNLSTTARTLSEVVTVLTRFEVECTYACLRAYVHMLLIKLDALAATIPKLLF